MYKCECRIGVLMAIRNYSKFFIALLLFVVSAMPVTMKASNPSRIKDIVTFEGIRDNMLVGYGLVVGLNGSGDGLANSFFTKQALIDFLTKMGVNIKGSNLKTKNIAAVTVTASLHAFGRQGSRIDVNVSTIGDAKSLEGGTLLATPLLGADGEVYAVAQGSVSISGFKAVGKSATVSKGVATNGFISNGAIIEKEINFKLNSLPSVNISLNNPDISTAVNISEIINDRIGENIARALDPSTINVSVPEDMNGDVMGLLAKIENIEVRPDTIAKVIIDEASGTIVIGENVRISPVGIAQGNLTIKIEEDQKVSQPNANTGGASPFIIGNNNTANGARNNVKTVVTDQTKVTVVQDPGTKMQVLEGGTTLKTLVDALNSLGVTPRDLITILQNIKASGALQADIEVR